MDLSTHCRINICHCDEDHGAAQSQTQKPSCLLINSGDTDLHFFAPLGARIKMHTTMRSPSF